MLPKSANPLITCPSEQEPSRRIVRRSVKATLARLQREDNAAQHLGELPAPGEDVVLILDMKYHGWDLVTAILNAGGSPARVWIATLGFNARQADNLAERIDSGQISAVTMIVSDMFEQKNRAECAALRRALGDRGQRIATARNHAKLVCFEFETGERIALHGSLNLRTCNSFEQAVISNCPDLFEFYRDYIEAQA